ncbi:Lar family restriction alleviation protein [Pusillimonas caeni]|uniref:Lar family restriction alleviation protein n=1 Tax=Pusillimonas caeni TaxID=1348472 RepID=UPI0014311193|nr:Lar family restriction alleviation protein [Pusillimonas caeni]
MTTKIDIEQERATLLPCPFCGGEAHIERIGTPRQSCQIACGNCGAWIETGEQGNECGNAWNRRAALQSQVNSEASNRVREFLDNWLKIRLNDKTVVYQLNGYELRVDDLRTLIALQSQDREDADQWFDQLRILITEFGIACADSGAVEMYMMPKIFDHARRVEEREGAELDEKVRYAGSLAEVECSRCGLKVISSCKAPHGECPVPDAYARRVEGEQR